MQTMSAGVYANTKQTHYQICTQEEKKKKQRQICVQENQRQHNT